MMRGCVCIDPDELSMKLLRPSIEFKPQKQLINVREPAKVWGMYPMAFSYLPVYAIGAEMATSNCCLLSRRI
ncbi:Uncharacterized protein HZ326_0220 [Fusarium oxysporum f. sp. albedinis]|nr:Uncharacterized protein HZ326_0220 [Fusarium oxysporum f. sp. albedinis]